MLYRKFILHAVHKHNFTGAKKLARHSMFAFMLTYWGWVTHICVDNQSIIGSDNGFSPCWRQAITWTNVKILFIGPLGTNFSEISIGIHTFLFNKMHWKMSPGKCQPFCLGLNVLTHRMLGNNYKSMICKIIVHNSSLGTYCKIALRWMPQNLINWKSSLVKVMAWC